MAPSTELPLVTLLPRAWIGFRKAPWRCVGLATALLLSAIGPALLGEDLRQLGFGWLGDLMVAASLVLPLLPLLALLRLADQLLPAESASKPPLSWGWLVRRAADAVLAVQLGAGPTSAGASPPQSTAGDGSQPATGAPQRLEGTGVVGIAHRNQSARTDRCLPGPAVQPSIQRPDPDGLLPNSNAMQERFPPEHVAHVNAGDLPGLNPVLHQEAR
ncbi:putative membrane protein [Synechococcus sp. RS9915]|nr:putative membrane protein [Synechococcus sp. RS9915]